MQFEGNEQESQEYPVLLGLKYFSHPLSSIKRLTAFGAVSLKGGIQMKNFVASIWI
jgi:hypothetical protein